MSLSEKILDDLKGGLIVSCQARRGWPMYGEKIMAAFANAAKQGGACGIRANEPSNVKEIKEAVDIPVIGINKIWSDKSDVYITPTFDSAAAVIESGADILALDATGRSRPNGETLPDIIKRIKKKYPTILIMGDIANLDDAKFASNSGCDLVATTLSGYTNATSKNKYIDVSLVKEISNKLTLPVVAEGKVRTPSDAKKTLDLGAHSVVVGTMITRPEIITKTFVNEIKKGG